MPATSAEMHIIKGTEAFLKDRELRSKLINVKNILILIRMGEYIGWAKPTVSVVCGQDNLNS